MNEQNILDAIDDLASQTEKLKTEVSDLKKINTELKTQVSELKEYVSTLE